MMRGFNLLPVYFQLVKKLFLFYWCSADLCFTSAVVVCEIDLCFTGAVSVCGVDLCFAPALVGACKVDLCLLVGVCGLAFYWYGSRCMFYCLPFSFPGKKRTQRKRSSSKQK